MSLKSYFRSLSDLNMLKISVQIPEQAEPFYFLSSSGTGSPLEVDSSSWGSVVYEIWENHKNYTDIYDDLYEKSSNLNLEYSASMFIGTFDQKFFSESEALAEKIYEGLSILKKHKLWSLSEEIEMNLEMMERNRQKYKKKYNKE